MFCVSGCRQNDWNSLSSCPRLPPVSSGCPPGKCPSSGDWWRSEPPQTSGTAASEWPQMPAQRPACLVVWCPCLHTQKAFSCKFTCLPKQRVFGRRPTFKFPQDVFTALGVQTGADERKDRNLLHFLFVSCEGQRKHHCFIILHTCPADEQNTHPVTQKEKMKTSLTYFHLRWRALM